MTYRIAGLDPERFADVDGLLRSGAMRTLADAPNAYPCRVSLEDAEPGEALLLINFVSADVATPFRASHAIYVRECAASAPVYHDSIPLMLNRRILSLRGFDAGGMLADARLAPAGTADGALHDLFGDPRICHVDMHNAAYGCFLARAEACHER